MVRSVSFTEINCIDNLVFAKGFVFYIFGHSIREHYGAERTGR